MDATHALRLARLLKALHPICDLTDDERLRLTQTAHVTRMDTGEQVEATTYRGNLTYVVRGELVIHSEGKPIERVAAESPRSMLPLFKVHPPGIHAAAVMPSMLLHVDREAFETIAKRHIKHPETGDEEIELHGDEDGGTLFIKLYDAYQSGELAIPSLPEVVVRIQHALRDDMVDLRTIARLLMADPALSARLLHVANSAAYNRGHPARTVHEAVTRLGITATQNITLALGMKQLFKANSPPIRTRVQQLYRHSTLIASLSYVLARNLPHFDAERAMLAGLLHDIGAIPVLAFLERHPDLMIGLELEDAIGHLRAPAGRLALTHLNFDAEMITVAMEAEEWTRDVQQPDYCDIVIVAQLHCALTESGRTDLPRLDQTPVYARLGLGEFDPTDGLKVLREGMAIAEAVQQMLS